MEVTFNPANGQEQVVAQTATPVQDQQAQEIAKESENLAIILNNKSLNIPVAVREQIQQKAAELKAQNSIKKIFVVVVQGDVDSGEKPLYVGYFRRPNMMQFSQYMSFVQKDIVQANLMLARNTFVSGDKELVDDDELFLYGTMQQLGHIIDARNSDIVKR